MLDHHTGTVSVPGARQPNAPQAVRIAAWVMYYGAIASLIRVVMAFVSASATKSAIAHSYPTLSASSVTTVTRVAVLGGAAVALVSGVLFAWIARTSLAGKNGARIAATVLCAVAILFALLSLGYGARSSEDQILNFVVAGIGLISTCLLWQRSSNGYFQENVTVSESALS